MAQTEPTRQSDEIIPPLYGTAGASLVCLPVTTGVLIVDMTSLAQTPALPQTTAKAQEHTNPIGQYMTLIADGGPVYVAFAATTTLLASLSTTATSTVTQSGAAAFQIPNGGTTNGVFLLAAGIPYHWRIPPGPAQAVGSNSISPWGANSPGRFLGCLTAAGTATLRIHVSSR
jgi:hypothetical protein